MKQYTTTTIRESERFSFWRDLVSDSVIHMDIEQTLPQAPFFGSVRSCMIGSMQFACVHSIPQTAVRSTNQISKSTEDAALFCFDLAGMQRLSLPKHAMRRELNPGDWVVLDSATPFRWSFPGKHVQLTLKIDREKLRNHALLPERNPAIVVPAQRGLGRMVFDTVTSFWQEGSRIPVPALDRLEHLLTELLAQVLSEYGRAGRHSRCHYLRKIEIKSFIKEHLRDPELTVDSVAGALNISSRYLYDLFKGEDTTIGRYIRELRLAKCQQDLKNPRQVHRSITEICYYWGFNDSAHFSKLFKSYFGLSPRHYRRQWLASPKEK